MKARWLWLATLIGLGAAALVYWRPAPRTTVAMTSLPMRFEAAVLGPQGLLGREENGPFLDTDCWWEGGVVSVGSPRRSRLSFVAKSKTGLQIELETRFQALEQEQVVFALNGTGWLSCRVTPDWSTFRADLPDELVRRGRNELTMSMQTARPIQFRKLRIRPQYQPPEPPPPEQKELVLPWEANLAIALTPGRTSRLRCQGIQTQLDPGAPPVTGATLRLSLQGPDRQWQQDVAVTKGPLDIALPTSSATWSKLQLRALGEGRPLPGQLGLKLLQPRLEVESFSSPPEPAQPAKQEAARDRPNVIVYLVDTLRPDHLGCYGYQPSPSPALDRFAKDAVLFLDASAQSGWTKPATASIFSSQWPWRHGVQDFGDLLSPDVPWLPQILQSAGYQTAAVVTNRLAGSDFGYDRGYDSFRQLPKDTSESANMAALEWLQERSAQKPFFLYIHTIDPHAPYMHSPAYRGKTRARAEEIDQEPRLLAEEATFLRFRGRPLEELKSRVDRLLADYDGEIANNDHSFGLLVEWLKAHRVYDNTLIIVVSDHGEEFLEHGYVGHLNSLYQELLHIPMLIKFPGQSQAGTRVAETWQQIDLAPTVLKACGIAAPSAFQGLAYQDGKPAGPRPCLFSVEAGRFLASQPKGKKAIFCSAYGIRQGDWVYERILACGPGQRQPEELYDLRRDPGQQKNLADSDPGRALSLAVPLESLFSYDRRSPTRSDESNQKLIELLKSLQYLH